VIVDSSAVVAMLLGEPSWERLLSCARQAQTLSMSAATWLESAIVVDGRNDPVLSRELDELVERLHIIVEAVTPEQTARARGAFRDYGKGRHPAALNLGDCFTYALAAERREPLLCLRNDFRQTDLELVDLTDGDG
jgi:ribonuclease VapC